MDRLRAAAVLGALEKTVLVLWSRYERGTTAITSECLRAARIKGHTEKCCANTHIAAKSVVTSLYLCSRQDSASQISDSFEEILPNTSAMQALFCNSPERSFSSLQSMQIMKATLFFSITLSNPAHQPINSRTEKQPKSCFQREISGNSKAEKPSGTGNLLSQKGCCTALLTLH